MASDIRSWLDGAERKEKAMKILSQVQEIEQAQTTLVSKRFEVWSKAETQMKLDGVESDSAWDLWSESLALQEQIEENRQEIHHLLQGALVYDPELIETHQKLVAFEYEDYLSALLDADLKRQQKFAEGCVFILSPYHMKRQTIGMNVNRRITKRLQCSVKIGVDLLVDGFKSIK